MKINAIMRNYIPLIPPLEKAFIDLSRKEAEAYFEWFLAHIDERSEYLREIIILDLNISTHELDYSVESLKTIWSWFLSIAELSNIPRTEIKKMRDVLKNMPSSFVEHMVRESKNELSVFTRFVLRDIGMYLGKVLKLNYPVLQWTFKTKPKNYISVNEPLLIGFIDDNPLYPKPFHPDLEPISFVEGCALNILDGTQHENDLYNMCMQWIKWIPND